LLSIGEELAGEERAGEETEVIERDGKRLILVNPRGQVSYLRREVGENELTASRGQVEDELRRDVLAVFLEGERLEKVRAILNRPWDEAGIGYLWGLVEHVVPERRRSAERVGLVQRSNILRLLAHVSTKYGDSKEATLIRSKFDSLLLKLADPEAKPPVVHPSIRYKFRATVVNAIEEHGSLDLLGPGFWECFETRQTGLRALRKLGDAQALERLRHLDKVLHAWGIDSDSARAQLLRETIRIIEERLAKAEEQQK